VLRDSQGLVADPEVPCVARRKLLDAAPRVSVLTLKPDGASGNGCPRSRPLCSPRALRSGTGTSARARSRAEQIGSDCPPSGRSRSRSTSPGHRKRHLHPHPTRVSLGPSSGAGGSRWLPTHRRASVRAMGVESPCPMSLGLECCCSDLVNVERPACGDMGVPRLSPKSELLSARRPPVKKSLSRRPTCACAK